MSNPQATVNPASFRIGQGFDVHGFQDNRDLMLCGVKIPHDRGLAGHSDADVALHALTDALLGAVGARDIGTWFPDTDAKFKNADSGALLAQVWKKLSADSYCIGNVDLTIVAEAPKLAAHIPQMTERIADLLGCESTQVNVKATTTERLGFIGREEGIAALAVALVYEKV